MLTIQKIAPFSKSTFPFLCKTKLTPLQNVFTESKGASYYGNIKFKYSNFEFSETSPEAILNILKGLNPSKAAGINKLFGKSLKDGADILASQFLNFLISLSNSVPSLEVLKLKRHTAF